jgi:hypothetical protein
MAWQTEMVRILRYIVNDLDSSSYSFSDTRLEETILVATQLVLTEIDFDQTYTVDVDALSLDPDPTTLSDKDDAFISLVSLKAACVILGSEVRTNSLNAVSVKDGASSIDMKGVAAGLMALYKDLCGKYDQAVLQYKAGNSVVGHAILSPYSPGSEIISRPSDATFRSNSHFK